MPLHAYRRSEPDRGRGGGNSKGVEPARKIAAMTPPLMLPQVRPARYGQRKSTHHIRPPGSARATPDPGLRLVELLQPSRVDGCDPLGLLRVGGRQLRLVGERSLTASLQPLNPALIRKRCVAFLDDLLVVPVQKLLNGVLRRLHALRARDAGAGDVGHDYRLGRDLDGETAIVSLVASHAPCPQRAVWVRGENAPLTDLCVQRSHAPMSKPSGPVFIALVSRGCMRRLIS